MVVTGGFAQGHMSNYGNLSHTHAQREHSWRTHLDGAYGSAKVLGGRHPQTLDQLVQLGQTLLAQGRLPEAEMAFSQCWEGRRETLGEAHPMTHRALRELAEVRRRCGHRDAAQEVLYKGSCHGFDTRHPLGSSPQSASLRSLGVALKAGARLSGLEKDLAASLRPGSTPLWKSKSETALAKAKSKAVSHESSFVKGKGRRLDPEAAAALLREFAVICLNKYGDGAKAFKAFDINGNGTLSGSEFAQYAKLIFDGDVTAVFKALDEDALGDISVKEFSILDKIYHEVAKSGELDVTIKPSSAKKPTAH